MGQLDLWSEAEIEAQKFEPAVQDFPKHDRTPATEQTNMIADGWIFHCTFMSYLFNADNNADMIERPWVHVTTPQGEKWQLVWDFETGQFMTQGELEHYLYGKPMEATDYFRTERKK